ncbi:MAG: pantoate--beta-alanine ligase [Deltaproteobacteria bacterium]|nr:pantoate--beta-alanine ligase [Deltaproteobacteria bacterium]
MPIAPVIKEPEALITWAEEQHRGGHTIGVVPTMGYLHEGHVSLVRRAKAECARVVASIFVNPTQFGPKEDLARYPRDLGGDLAKLSAAGVDLVFVPEKEAMYPAGFDTYVVPGEIASTLCGASRPGHFRGVATVVLMLLRMARADRAYFGEKDFQQLAVIRRMAKDLWLGVDVIGCPIVREPDGLAMSSRNVYLSPRERAQAVCLSQALAAVANRVAAGERHAEALRALMRTMIEAADTARVDYVEVVDALTLRPITTLDRDALAAVAVFFGKTRLIDNRQLHI